MPDGEGVEEVTIYALHITIFEGIISDLGYESRDVHIAQAGAVGKGMVPDALQLGGELHIIQRGATDEGVIYDGCERVGHGDILEAGAVAESEPAERGEVGRQHYRIHPTTGECTLPDRSDAIAKNRDLFQVAILDKSPFGDIG